MPLQRGSTRHQTTARPVPGSARAGVVVAGFLAPDCHLLGMSPSLLAGSPCPSSLVPGIILFTFVGIAPLLAAAITVRRQALAPVAAIAVGLTLIGWVSVEMVVLAGLGSLAWALYLVLGACIAAIGVAWWRSSPRADAI